jgi:hypothetical protein
LDNLRAPADRPEQGAARNGAVRRPSNLNWDGVWKVWSQVTRRGWESEMVIPFKTLRYRPGIDHSWGLNMTRNLRRRNEQTFWSNIPRGFTLYQIDMAGQLEGLELKTQHNLQLTPYALGGFKQDYTHTDPTDIVHKAGADLKFSLTPSLTLDATFNTDFAQVEVDEEQINLTELSQFGWIPG